MVLNLLILVVVVAAAATAAAVVVVVVVCVCVRALVCLYAVDKVDRQAAVGSEHAAAAQ